MSRAKPILLSPAGTGANGIRQSISRDFHVILAQCLSLRRILGFLLGGTPVSRDALSIIVIGLLILVAVIAVTLAFRF